MRLRISMLIVVAVVSGACKEDEPPAPSTVVTTTIKTSGETVKLPGGAEIVIPAGAVDAPLKITVSMSTPPTSAGFAVAGPFFTFKPEKQHFEKPLTIRLPITASDTTGIRLGWTERCKAFNRSPAWISKPAKIVAGKLEGQVFHFSEGGAAKFTTARCCFFLNGGRMRVFRMRASDCTRGKGVIAPDATCDQVCCHKKGTAGVETREFDGCTTDERVVVAAQVCGAQVCCKPATTADGGASGAPSLKAVADCKAPAQPVEAEQCGMACCDAPGKAARKTTWAACVAGLDNVVLPLSLCDDVCCVTGGAARRRTTRADCTQDPGFVRREAVSACSASDGGAG